MNTLSRVLIGIFMPPVIGAIFFMMWTIATEYPTNTSFTFSQLPDVLNSLGFLLIFAFLTTGITAIIFSLLMEFVVYRFVKNELFYLAVSAVLGFISAIIPYLILQSLWMLLLGVIVGLIIGKLLFSLHKKQEGIVL